MDSIAGIETEYGFTGLRNGLHVPTGLVLLTHFGAGAKREWLRNGACYYVDNYLPEYATPECRRVADLVAHDRAGERYVAARAAHVARRTGLDVHVFKNNSDSAGNSYGCHENYELDYSLMAAFTGADGRSPVEALDVLTSFFATRPLIAGCRRPGRHARRRGLRLESASRAHRAPLRGVHDRTPGHVLGQAPRCGQARRVRPPPCHRRRRDNE